MSRDKFNPYSLALRLALSEVSLLISKEQRPTRYDPILYDFELPLRGMFHPRGFSAEISTNSPEVLLAAEESWGTCYQAYLEPPGRVHIGGLSEP